MAEPEKLFREEALQHQSQRFRREGDVLRLPPAWTRWTYWVIVAAVSSGALLMFRGTTTQYARGPVFVVIDGGQVLTAPSTGIVSALEVYPGQRVTAGEVLVRFTQPGGDGASTDADIVKAPHAGTVLDVRIREQERVQAGAALMRIVGDDEARPSLLALIPERNRAAIRPAAALRYRLDAAGPAWHAVPVDSVGDEVLGPEEVGRYVDQLGMRAVPDGVVAVRAELPRGAIRVKRKPMRYGDGMRGLAELEIGSERILYTIFPGLNGLVGRRHE